MPSRLHGGPGPSTQPTWQESHSFIVQFLWSHLDFSFHGSFLLQASSELLDLKRSRSSFEIFIRLQTCCKRRLRNLSSPRAKSPLNRSSRLQISRSGEVHGFTSLRGEGGAQRRARARSALPSSVTTDANERNVVKE